MLPSFIDEDAAKNVDVKLQLIDRENTITFLETKLNKLNKELAIANVKLSKKPQSMVAMRECERIKWVEQVRSLKSKNSRIQAYGNLEHSKFTFLRKRVVAVYGNKALVDLLAHVENPDFTTRDMEGLMKVQPIY